MMPSSIQISNLLFFAIMGLLAILVVVPLWSIAAERLRPLFRGHGRWSQIVNPNQRTVSNSHRAVFREAAPGPALVDGPQPTSTSTGVHEPMYSKQESWPPRRKRSGPGFNRRQFVRVGTELRGYIAQDFRLSECEILDMSKGGARVCTDGTLGDQAYLTLGFGRFGTIAGEVVWRRNRILGLKYVDTPQAIQQTLSGLMPQACLASWSERSGPERP